MARSSAGTLLYSLRRAGRFFWRALRWKCPLCGQSPIFPPLRKTRSLYDWFTPQDGCPRCGYAYDREPGYFLMSIWAVGYGFSGLLGMAIYLVLIWKFELSLPLLMLSVVGPVMIFSFFFARHAKAFYLAFDHFFDPAIDEPAEPR